MRAKNYLLFLAVLLVRSYAVAQPWMQPKYLKINQQNAISSSFSFYDIQNAFLLYEKHYEKKTEKENVSDGDEDEGKFPGYCQYKRWEWHMAPRVYPSGDLTLPSTNYEEFQKYLHSNNYRNGGNAIQSFSGNWTPLGPTGTHLHSDWGGAARVNFIRIHPTNSNIMYTGSPTGGLWKTIDGGLNWTTNTDQLSIIGTSDVAINPVNPLIMYLATGDANGTGSQLTLTSIGILKSTDGGQTWGSNTMNWQVGWGRNIYKILINPDHPDTVLAATTNGIYRTTNAGGSWIQMQAGLFTDIEFKPGNPNVIYAVAGIVLSGGTFYKSTDCGSTFIPISSGLPLSANVARLEIAVTPADTNYVYVVAVKKTTNDFYGFYRSVDGGDNFALRANTPNILAGVPGSQAWYNLAMAVSPLHKDTIIVGATDAWKTTDGGLTWTKHTSNNGWPQPFVHPDFHALVYAPGNDSTYFAGSDGGVWKTTDYGVTWNPINEGLQISQMYKLGTSTLHPYTITTGHQDMGTHELVGNNWSLFTPNTGDGMECIYEHDNDTVIYMESYNGRLIVAYNTFPLFNVVCTFSGAGVNAAGAWITPVVMHPAMDSTLLVGKAQVWRTVNGGQSFLQVGNVSAGGGNLIALAYAPSDPNYIYAAKQSKLFVSTNGNTFGDSTGTLPIGSASITGIAVSNTDPLKVWVTFSGYSAANKVWYSDNGGSTWINYSTGLPNLPVNCIVYQNNSNNALYVGTDVGVYTISDTVAAWQPFFTGLPNVDVEELEIAYSINKIRAATNGRGLWESDLPVVTVVPLPVSLLSFTGFNRNENNYLNWSTASDNQTMKFEIEKSSDAKNYFKIGEVSTHGNSTGLAYYNFIDYNVELGFNYYRLRIIDFNGSVEFSNIVAIQNPLTGLDFEVYPVPFKNEMNVQIFSNTNQPADLKVTDIIGRVLINSKIQLNGVEETNINLNTLKWNSGIYFVSVGNVIKKIVKQ